MIFLISYLAVIVFKALGLIGVSWLAILSPALIVGVSLTIGLVIAWIMGPEERRA